MHKDHTSKVAKPETVRLQGKTIGYKVGVDHKTLVMALIGMSHARDYLRQLEKIVSLEALPNGPDIISDLSIVRTTGEPPLWKVILNETSKVAACLPIYTASVRNGYIDANEVLDIAIEQMENGVGLLTIHPTPSKHIQQMAEGRLVPCTSRGGGLVITDLKSRGWAEENVYLKIFPELIHHAGKNGTALSIGASYRSANIFDSFDAAQQAEIELQLTLAKEISDRGVGVIIESPGHSRPRDIKKIGDILRPGGFPIMPLGPIPTDAAIGMDHISSAIGATLFGLQGCAQIIAAVTREEHTGGVPSVSATIEAVQAARVAAHVVDLHMLNDDADDFVIANARATSRTCVLGKASPGCDRCVHACPLIDNGSPHISHTVTEGIRHFETKR